MSSTSTEPLREPWAFLLGRPPIDEYLSFLIQASPGQNVDIQAAAEDWRRAEAVIDELTVSEAGAADGRAESALPTELASRASRYFVFQRQISLRYAGELQTVIGDWDVADERLFNFCFGVDQSQPPINRMQVAANAFVFQSISTDARFLGAALIDASQVTGYVPGGRATSAIVLFVGYGVNALSVININGRLVLNNGSHRAYALKAAGVAQVPAVIQDVAHEHELSVVSHVQQNQQLYLHNQRPPMLKDFFNPALHHVIEAPRRSRQVRLQFAMDTLDAPG